MQRYIFNNSLFLPRVQKNVVRKVERQYQDISEPGAEMLRINSKAVEEIFRNFHWDFARYQYPGRQLSELVSQIQVMAAKVDEELKNLSLSCNEKSLAYSNLLRRKTINLVTSDFEDFLTPEKVSKLDIIHANPDHFHFLETVMVVVPKALEAGFKKHIWFYGFNIFGIQNFCEHFLPSAPT